MYAINIGKTGETVNVDESKFNDTVRDYVFRYGLTQILNDAHSAVTEKAEPDRDARLAAVAALVAKKLDALYAGDVRSNGGGRTGDPVMAEAKRAATAMIRKAAGKAFKDFTAEAVSAAVKKLIETKPEILAEAKATVEARGAAAKSVDLSALGL